jgi:hypothetical protein
MTKIGRFGIVLLITLLLLWAAEKGLSQIFRYIMRDAEF